MAQSGHLIEPPGRPLWVVSSTDQRNTYLKPRTWSDGDEEVSLGWVYSSSERGALGALEEGRRPEVDRTGLWQAVLLHFCAFEAQRRDHAAGPAPISSGADDGGTRGDLSGHCGGPIGPGNSEDAGSRGIDGQRDQSQRLGGSLSGCGG